MTTHDVRSLAAPVCAPADSPSGAGNAPVAMPTTKPQDPNFSSGPCTKFPSWSVDKLVDAAVGRSHRAKEPKAKLKAVIDRSKAMLGLPDDWMLGIVPGSDTGAVEMMMWSLLGARPVDVCAWESFGSGWLTDVTKKLTLKFVNYLFLSCLNILNIIIIYALLSYLNSGYCSTNILQFLFLHQ